MTPFISTQNQASISMAGGTTGATTLPTGDGYILLKLRGLNSSGSPIAVETAIWSAINIQVERGSDVLFRTTGKLLPWVTSLLSLGSPNHPILTKSGGAPVDGIYKPNNFVAIIPLSPLYAVTKDPTFSFVTSTRSSNAMRFTIQYASLPTNLSTIEIATVTVPTTKAIDDKQLYVETFTQTGTQLAFNRFSSIRDTSLQGYAIGSTQNMTNLFARVNNRIVYNAKPGDSACLTNAIGSTIALPGEAYQGTTSEYGAIDLNPTREVGGGIRLTTNMDQIVNVTPSSSATVELSQIYMRGI